MQSAESWLFAIARNYLRKQSRHCCLSLPAEEVLPSCCSAEDAAMREETELLLQDLLQRLPLSQRQTIYACCYLGLRPAQAAALLQADPHAVSGRLYRGLKTLRKMWEALR